jgi:hypothetical protein
MGGSTIAPFAGLFCETSIETGLLPAWRNAG